MITEQSYIFYNPLAGNGEAEDMARTLAVALGPLADGPFDMTKITNYSAFLSDKKEGNLILCGGDGTLNRFLNDTAELELTCEIYLMPVGTGNDFLRDIEADRLLEPVRVTPYVKALPVCEIDGRRFRFLNGIGFGIDGYCCEEGDRLRAKGQTKVNYASLAVKGLLLSYKPCGATVTVDGVPHRYEKVWIAPTMHGRFYGGGIMPTPEQKRTDPDGLLSVMVLHGIGKLKTLALFPSLFKGEHVSHTKAVDILRGHEIIVEFDRPSPAQIDGETVSNVTKHRTVCAEWALRERSHKRESKPNHALR